MSDSFSFIEGRGKLIAVTELSSGIVSVDGLRCIGDNGNVVWDSVTIGGKDITSPTDALGNKHVLYVFGEAFKQVQLTGTYYLTGCDNAVADNSKMLHDLKEFFDVKRVYNSMDSIDVSVGEIKVGMYITDFTLGQMDSVNNTILFTIDGYARPRK